MTVLIDKTELMEHVIDALVGDTYEEVVLLEDIYEAPTVDAVEVVRCKDCRYFKKIAERSDSGLCHRDIVASAWKDNGYCSRGERKGGDIE